MHLSLIRYWRRGALAVMLAAVGACSPSSLVDVDPPSGTVDPSAIHTPESALQFYNFAVTRFDTRFAGVPNGVTPWFSFVRNTAVFTDELLIAGYSTPGIDERMASEDPYPIYEELYRNLHQARIATGQAREALRAYAPNSPVALQGQLQALEAYTIVWLAEAFCSGIPLTKVPLVGESAPTAGYTTQELYRQAIALFDSALVLGTDSARFINLARVGKGRAYLNLGLADSAALAVHDVPTDFAYLARFNGSVNWNEVSYSPRSLQMVDHEGTNGLVWTTDPRAVARQSPAETGTLYLPGKYSLAAGGAVDVTTSLPANSVRVADGVEARLIEAEADLANHGSAWLGILNTLRSSCVGTAACATAPEVAPGSLPALTDPITDSLRVDTLFHERAKWLYLTGHRLGDLRRLVRNYHRNRTELWPVGTYSNPGVPGLVSPVDDGATYGNDFVMTVGRAENGNRLYTGCVNLDP